jgi:hypothetical protein
VSIHLHAEIELLIHGADQDGVGEETADDAQAAEQ